MHISLYAFCLLLFSLSFLRADPDVSNGKPAEGSYADTGLLRNNDIDKEHNQKLERFVEFRKQLKQREKERHEPNNEANPFGENGGKPPTNGINTDHHRQTIKHILQSKKRLEPREKERHAPESNEYKEAKPVAENDGSPLAIDIGTEYIQKIKHILQLSKRLEQREIDRHEPNNEANPFGENGGKPPTNGINTDHHRQTIKHILQSKKRLEPRENERHAPESNEYKEAKSVAENDGRPLAIDIGTEYRQKIKHILQLSKRLEQREIDRHAPDSDNKEANPVEENGRRPPSNEIDKEHLQKIKLIHELRKQRKLSFGGEKAAGHRNNGISVTPPRETSLLADKALWIGIAVCSGFFVMALLCWCVYKCVVRIRSRLAPVLPLQRCNDIIDILAMDKAGWESEAKLNVPPVPNEWWCPRVSSPVMESTSISIPPSDEEITD